MTITIYFDQTKKCKQVCKPVKLECSVEQFVSTVTRDNYYSFEAQR